MNENLNTANLFDLLRDLIKEDRKVISSFIERITKVLQWFLLASFGITAYLFKPYLENTGACPIALLIGSDLFFLITSLIFAIFMLYELRFLRINMEMREDMLKEIIKNDIVRNDWNPFRVEDNRIPRIKDFSIFLNIGIVALIYSAKIIAIGYLFCCNK